MWKGILSYCCISSPEISTQFILVVWSLSCVRLLNLCTVAHQAPLSMGFPRQGYWSGLPFPPPEDLSDPEIEPMSTAWQADSLPLSHQGSPPSTLEI